MKKEDLLDAIGAVGEEYLERSENAGAGKKFGIRKFGINKSGGAFGIKESVIKKPAWKKWSGLAACACVLLVVGALATPYVLNNIGGMGSSSGGGGSDNTDGSTVFMSYAGPVFPMTALEGAEKVSVKRDITFDFQPWVPVWYSNEQRLAELKEQNPELTEAELADAAANYAEWYPEGGYYRTSGDVLVEDTYLLSNTTTEEQNVTLLYPFVSSIRSLEENMVALTDEVGAELETALHMGGYSGGFRSVEGSPDTEELLNVEEITGWEEYKDLLADGSYLEHALHYEADLSDIPVTVYRFTEDYGPERTDDMPNPTLRAMYDLDYEKTWMLSYGFNGGYNDRENNRGGRQYSIRQQHNSDYGEPCFLIVLGEDIKNLEVTGYVTGGWDTEEVIADAGVTVTRETMDLDTILREVVALKYEKLSNYEEPVTVDYESYYRMFVDMLESYGVLSDNAVARYEDGMLEFMDVYGLKRVCYLETQVTIPAGESITLTATMSKDPSYDYYCAHTENQGIDGYDMVTRLGSSLNITDTSAHIEDRDMVEIVRQNFGFDLDNGIRTVILDADAEHYYLEVRGK